MQNVALVLDIPNSDLQIKERKSSLQIDPQSDF